MAEAAIDDSCVIPLEVYGDEKLKQFFEGNITGVEVTCNEQRLELKGSKRNVEKAKASFCEVSVDHYRKQFIITENLPLIYLNENLGDEVCYLVKNRKAVFACIPHHNRIKCTERVSKLIEKNIIKQNLENHSADLISKINDLMINNSGKVICIEDSVLVYTADIAKDVDEAIGTRITGLEAEVKTTQDANDVCIDEGGKRFIETHCPGVKVHRSNEGFSLHHNKSAMQVSRLIEISNLDIDNRKLQLILTEDDARNFLNKQLKGCGILGYVMKNERKVCAITLYGKRKDLKKITYFIDKNICVEELDNQDDSNLLIDYSGKLTHLVQENKTYLVFTKDIEIEIGSFLIEGVNPTDEGASMKQIGSRSMNKMKQDGADRRYAGEQLGVHNGKVSEYVRVTQTGTNHSSLRGDGKSDNNTLTKGFKGSEDSNNVGMLQQTGEENGMRPVFKGGNESNMTSQTWREAEDYDSNNSENDLEGSNSYENLDCIETHLDTDVAEYLFTHMKSDILKLGRGKKKNCSIDNKNGKIIVSDQCDRTALEKVVTSVHEMARAVVMDSCYIVEDEVEATQTDTFKDLKDELKKSGTEVQLYACDEARTVEVFMYKGVEIQLVHGSAADCKRSDAILCPLDAKLKPMSAAGHHIMIKGGEPLQSACQKVIEKRGNLSDFQTQVFNESGQLQVKNVHAMAVHNLYVGTPVEDEKIRKKIKHLFQDMINRQSISVTIPLEFGQRIPVAVMVNACCKGLQDILSENIGNIINRVNLCCVNGSQLPLITELLKTEILHENQDTTPKKDKLKTTQKEIYGPSKVCVVLNCESLIDQKVDAIVVPVNSKLDLTQGAVSHTVLKAAGGSIQHELKKKMTQGIGPMEVTFTSPGYLNMKYILYSCLPKFTDGAYGLPEMRLGKVLEEIFILVKMRGIKSLALPALGTGGLNYPTEIVAVEMMRSIYMHAAQSGVNTVNIVVYKMSSENQCFFEKTLREYKDTVYLTSCMMKPVFVEISNPDWKHCTKIVENSTEVRMADTVIYPRKAGCGKENDQFPCEGMCVRKLETLSWGLMRERIFVDMSSVDNLDLKAQKALYHKGLQYAIIHLQSQFIFIDLTQDGAEERRVIIEDILRELNTLLKKSNRLSKLYFLVSPESLQSCIRRTKEGLSKRTHDKSRMVLPKFVTNLVSGSQLELEWQVKECKVPFTSGANMIVCSDNEEKLKKAVKAVRSKFSEYRNALIAKDSERKDGDETVRGNRVEPTGADRDQISFGNRDQAFGTGRDQTPHGNGDPTFGAGRDQKAHGDQDQTVSGSTGVYHKPLTPEDHYDTINDNSVEEDLKISRKMAINQNNKHLQHPDSDENNDDSVSIYAKLTTKVRSTELCHLSKRKLKSLMASLKEKSILAEYENDTVNVSCPHDRKEDLAVALQNKLSSLDRTVYYVHDVTQQMIFLLDLYKHQTGSKMAYSYVKAEQEIKITDSSKVYENIKAKCKTFRHYQNDNIDVSKASVSVCDTIREFIATRESKFENILLESLNNIKAISIHYPVNEQKTALEVKNSLLFQLGLVKPTGRRNRRFDDFTSLQETLKQTDETWDKHDVIKEEGSQYGYRLTSRPSSNTNAVSGNISSSMSSYTNSNQQGSYYGDRPSNKESGCLGGNAARKQERGNYGNMPSDIESGQHGGNAALSQGTSYSSKGANSMPVSGHPLKVQTVTTKSKDDLIQEVTYSTEKHLLIKVYNGNILKLNVDCITNAANEQLFHGAGVAGAISRAAGREFDKESRDYINGNGSLDVGQCISTGAGHLPYRHVLHAVGPQWAMYEDKADCEHDLMMTIYNTLRRAEVLNMESVAIPSISSGIFGVPWRVCAEQYAKGIELFDEDSKGVVKEVHFVDINSDILKEIQSLFSQAFKVITENED